MAYDTWTVVNTTNTAHTLGQWNSVCTVSNGYLGLKGNLAEQRDGYSPVTLVNGVYDELDMFSQIRASNEERRYLDARYFDTAGRSPAVANLPSPLLVQTFVGEREISLGRGEVLNFSQKLDLATGVYRYSFDYRDGAGRTTRVEMERFASLRHAHRVYMRYSLTALDHDAPLRVRSGLTGHVVSNTTRERQFTVTSLWTDPAERCRLFARTPARQHEIQMGVVNRLIGAAASAGALQENAVGVAEHDAVWTYYVFRPQRGVKLTIERSIVIATSEDLRHRQVVDFERELDAAAALGFDDALAEQQTEWSLLWQRADVQIDGDDPAQLGLRFCLFHLLQSAPRFTDRLSVPVKFLTGEYYQGNTFYDTDTYSLPFYNMVLPEYARTCLNWRWEGLRPGREIARALGYDGAKFAWQSGPYGEECLGKGWRFTHTNIHITGDATYALMQYIWASGDTRYLYERGLDLLVETARFYASRAKHDAATDTYHLLDVAGPDEGHCESTDNFYTNYLAIRNLRWAADALARAEQEDAALYAAARQRLALKADEPAKWRQVADRLALLLDPQTKVFEQFDGYYKLKDIPADLLDERKVWFVTVAPYKALNQPDIAMALVMFRDDFDSAIQKANWAYYKDKSMNFSSMSFVLNSIMAADMGEHDDAYKNFIISAGEDIDEGLTGRKDTYAGLHGTASGGAWMAAVMGFGGVNLAEGPTRGAETHPALTLAHAPSPAGPVTTGSSVLRINPNLPQQWTELRFNLVLRGVTLHVAIDHTQVTLTLGKERKLELPLPVAGKPLVLKSGESQTVKYS